MRLPKDEMLAEWREWVEPSVRQHGRLLKVLDDEEAMKVLRELAFAAFSLGVTWEQVATRLDERDRLRKQSKKPGKDASQQEGP